MFKLFFEIASQFTLLSGHFINVMFDFVQSSFDQMLSGVVLRYI